MKLLGVIRGDEVTEDGCICQYEELPTSMFGQKGCEIELKNVEDNVDAQGGDVKMETKSLFKRNCVAPKLELAWVDCFSRVCLCVCLCVCVCVC